MAFFVRTQLRERDELIRECDRLMRAPAFMAVFGTPDDEDSADGAGIVRAALRLVDIYERHLNMAEDCLDCDVPAQYYDLMRDCTELLVTPVRDHGAFMKGVLARFDEMKERSHAGDVDIVLAPVLLRTTTTTTTTEQLMWSILDRLNDIR